jgi:hypothetical protein
MALDPRLADTQLLALAAMRLRQRQEAAPTQYVTLKTVYYDAQGILPDEPGEEYRYALLPHERIVATEGGLAWRLIRG